ncbi:MAG: tetratricopeptide repeat protein [Bacteroidales bacterium]|nr:tetratricopeptide repeat protein [Bacteroidales bacterium]MBN2758517.1 tetratricopeptide repeat protein [Bacteroidales bacterium]
MLFKIKSILIFILTLNFYSAYTQENVIDSLKLEISKQTKDTNQVNSLLELAKQYQRIDLDSAMEFSNNALTISKILKFHKGSANAYRQIGILFYIKGDYEKAMNNLMLSLESWQNAGDNWGIARAYMNIGIIQKNLGEYNKALENYIKSSIIQKEINDVDGLARSYNNIVNIYLELGDFESSLDFSFKSLQIHEELKNEIEIAVTYNNIGNIYHAQEIENKAIEYFNLALEINKKINDKKGIADNYNNLAEVYSKMSENDTITAIKRKEYTTKVLDYLNKSLPLYEEIGFKKGVALSYTNIGDAYLQLGNYEKVLINYQKSLLANEEMGDKNGIIISLSRKGAYFDSIQDYGLAVRYFEMAKKFAEEIGSPERIMDVAEGLSFSYANIGKYKLAYQYHVLFKKMNDKIISEGNIKSSTQKEFRYRLNKKQKEMELEQQRRDMLATEELKRQSLITKGAVLGLALMFALAFFIFRSYRIKQKANIKLEAQHIEISQKNEELKQLNEEITSQREMVSQQRDIAVQARKEVMDSIQYAQRIQNAVLPRREMFTDLIPDYFIFFKPRDIVSGDFFWMKRLENHIVIAAADCTGHGVPGAFLSLLGVSFLNEIVTDNFYTASDILDSLRNRIIEALHQTWKDDEAKDGMDISLAVINTKTKELQFSGAYNPIYHIRNNELTEIKGDKMPIGIHIKEPKSFSNSTIQLQENDTIYLFSDGYADQFGGPKGGKYKYLNFKNLILSAQDKTMKEQKNILNQAFNDWKGDLKQLDDIIVIGMKF